MREKITEPARSRTWTQLSPLAFMRMRELPSVSPNCFTGAGFIPAAAFAAGAAGAGLAGRAATCGTDSARGLAVGAEALAAGGGAMAGAGSAGGAGAGIIGAGGASDGVDDVSGLAAAV